MSAVKLGFEPNRMTSDGKANSEILLADSLIRREFCGRGDGVGTKRVNGNQKPSTRQQVKKIRSGDVWIVVSSAPGSKEPLI